MDNAKYEVNIAERFCKRCGICVEFCPKKVLEIINQELVIKNGEACIGCGLCELMCPDFAIEIRERDE